MMIRTEPRVTVVIPSFNGRDLLESCLRALQHQTLPTRTVVADNGSTDGAVEMVLKLFPEIEILQLGSNYGFAVAANRGAAVAQSEYVAFLNNDTEPTADWLAALVDCLDQTPAAASAASRVLRLDDPEILDGAGDSLTRSLKAYRRGFGESAAGRYEDEDDVFSASGTACLWRTEIFQELGGFDETFFAYYEDVDLGFRARLAGYACKYVPSAVVRHAGSATAASDWIRLSAFHATANRWSTIVKDAPTRLLVRNCAAIGFGELVFLVRSAAVGQLPHVFAAYRHVFRSRARLRVKRRAIQSLRRYDDPCFRVLLQRRLPPLRMSLQRLRRPATPPR